jgi:L-fucose mutarotase
MLKTTLLHPDILRIVARGGHHSTILISDGNYPAANKKGPNAELICLQLMPGIPTVAQVLEALLSAVNVDIVNTMGIPADDPYAKFGEPPAWAQFRKLSSDSGVGTMAPISKWDFYKAVESPDHILTIQTADQALWANVLITLGCRTN